MIPIMKVHVESMTFRLASQPVTAPETAPAIMEARTVNSVNGMPLALGSTILPALRHFPDFEDLVPAPYEGLHQPKSSTPCLMIRFNLRKPEQAPFRIPTLQGAALADFNFFLQCSQFRFQYHFALFEILLQVVQLMLQDQDPAKEKETHKTKNRSNHGRTPF
jgi:hypothetical protein